MDSGSTGKPKGVLHTVGGYMLYAATTFKYSFDYQPGDVYWCTADIGWITGHSYVTYGPMLNCATSVMVSSVTEWRIRCTSLGPPTVSVICFLSYESFCSFFVCKKTA